MERGLASQLQAFFKATVLGLAILSMATWAPHMYVFLRNFFLVSIPSAVSAIVTPKCLFVFSNIIVIFLANESKLSLGGSTDDPRSLSSEDYIDVVKKHQQLVSTPVMIKERDGELAEMINEEEEEDSTVAVHGTLPQLDQCHDQLLDAASSIAGSEKLREDVVYDAIPVANFRDADVSMDNNEHSEHGRIELREEVIDEEEGEEDEKEEEEEEEEEEEMGLPTDELNRRVEDFIARFNMERQLEARMLVCCF